ncbi:MAG: ribose 5-phosphate isomerase B [Clostridiaceae bacterium]|jgi:ribose 5-phosphate isomerase B|nr:ribose 5-phosphate isomerase B [Clostridiaceae bacterium]
MRIAMGSDHAGYQLKRLIMDHLHKQGITCEDYGAPNGIDAASYVPFGQAVACAVISGTADYGIAICGTGLGISMTTNKCKGIRAALCTNEYMARMARQHNNANVLALGARVVGPALACSIVDAFLAEAFEAGGRHQVRVDEMTRLEDQNFKNDPEAQHEQR